MTEERIHPWRWRALTVWVVLFTAFTMWQWQDIRLTKADLAALHSTNCGLRNFLLAARAARFRSANAETGKLRAADLQAVRGYTQLLTPFTSKAVGHHCKIPKSVKRK